MCYLGKFKKIKCNLRKAKSRDASIKSRSSSSMTADDPKPKIIPKLQWDNLIVPSCTPSTSSVKIIIHNFQTGRNKNCKIMFQGSVICLISINGHVYKFPSDIYLIIIMNILMCK